MDIPADLHEGDCLLYKTTGLFGWIIGIKTWSLIGHCETYIGDGHSVASRDGLGVGRYPLRTEDLIYVLRPTGPVDLDAAQAWFLTSAVGQKYDWLGLLRFAWRSKVVPNVMDNRMFCSEFLTRFYRAGGLDPFNAADADAIAPMQFLLSNSFTVIDPLSKSEA